MKYVVIEREKNEAKGLDWFIREFENLEEAIEWADSQVGHMTYSERRKLEVEVLESANPDEDAEDHFDGDIIWSTSIWYAVLRDEDDNDWGYGSRLLSVAQDVARRMGAKYIAVIADDVDSPECKELLPL